MLKHPVITCFYRFLAEAIIVFLLILPFTFGYYDSAHYLGYILVIFITGGCFYLLEINNPPIGYFLLGLPISVLMLFLFDFPFVLTVFLPLLFIWRYLVIRSYKHNYQDELHLHIVEKRYERNQEKIYLHVTLILAVIDVIYIQEIVVAIYALLQFFILFGGYVISHLALVKKSERKQVNLRVFLAIPSFMLLGSMVVYYAFEPLRRAIHGVWVIIQSLFIFVISPIAQIVSFIFPGFDAIPLNDNLKEVIVESQENQRNPKKSLDADSGVDERLLAAIGISVICVFVLFLIMRSFKKKREGHKKDEQSITNYSPNLKRKKKEGLLKRIVGKYSIKPSHPVRNLVYKIERKAAKNHYGRYNYESFEEWFERLQVNIEIETYQKVRYGHLDVSRQEINKLEQQLMEIERSFMEKRIKGPR